MDSEPQSVLLFLDGPADRLEFSFDGVFGRIGEKFEGFFQVPPGIHFISYRMTGSVRGDEICSGEGPFTTVILNLVKSQASVLTFAWNQQEESFKLSNFDTCRLSPLVFSEKLLQYPGLLSYSRFMACQVGSAESWQSLTALIREQDLRRVFCETELVKDSQVFEVTSMHESHHSLLKGVNDCNSAIIRFIPIPSLKDFSKANPLLTTACAMDKTLIFDSLNVSILDLLAELQISFLLLTFAQNFEGFEQWIDIVQLLCHSGRLMRNNYVECERFLQLIQEHLESCPNDFFSGLMSENRLYRLLNDLFLSLGEMERFKRFYEDKFGWIFSQDTEEDLEDESPVIVEL